MEKNKLILLTGLILLNVTGLFASQFYHEKHQWTEQPALRPLSPEEAEKPAVVLLDTRTVEYYHDEEHNNLLQYYTTHSKVRVNSSEAVEMYNKEYISMARVYDVLDIKARVITKDRVKEVDGVELLDFEGSDDYSSYKYFAIEGVEVGSEVEFMYTLQMKAKLDGGREFFQSEELRKNTEFQIICPSDLHFSFKSYNGFPELQLDNSDSAFNRYVAYVETIPPLNQESYAPYTSELMRVEYKLDYMDPATDVKLYTYDQISTQLHFYLKKLVSKKGVKKLKGIIKELDLDDDDEWTKVRKIEDYLKGNYTIIDESKQEFEEIESIFENRYCNKRGMLKLFMSLFDMTGIQYEYGLTSDRSDIRFDPDFESYSFLESYVFYFPAIDQFMAPTELLFRVGFIPFNWTDNYGMFIYTDGGEIKDTVRYIKPLAFDQSSDIIDVKARFDGDFESIHMDISRTMTGYQATYLQPIFQLIPEKETSVVVTELLNLTGKDVELDSIKIENSGPLDLYVHPFILKGSAVSRTAFYDKAGSKHLFRIGEMIGKQIELYQEEKRQLPIENEYNRNYQRRIEFEIPDGYMVTNLDDIKMHIDHKEGDEITMEFRSDYQIQGNSVVVKIDEYYKKLTYPVEEFDQFRAVINAAADFNKKVLVFEKTS